MSRFIYDLRRHGRKIDGDGSRRLGLERLDDVLQPSTSLDLSLAARRQVQRGQAEIDDRLRSGQRLHGRISLVISRRHDGVQGQEHAKVTYDTKFP